MTKALRFGRWRTIVFSGFAAVLVWLVIARSFAAYFADNAPKMTLWLYPQQPSALVNLADQALGAADTAAPEDAELADEAVKRTANSSANNERSSGSPVKSTQSVDWAFSAFEKVGQNQSVTRPIAPKNEPTVRRWAETALINEPLNARALRILGQLAEADNDDASAVRFMDFAARLSLHESVADFWLLQKSAQAKDDKSALYYADVLLRTTPELATYVVPVVTHLAEEKGSTRFLSRELAGNPPWRKQFFEVLPNSITDARTPLSLLMELRASAAPPSPVEVGDYIDFLVARKFYDLAYYTWLQFLPPEQLRKAGMLFNGDFELRPSGSPFDWQIQSGAGVTIDIVPRSDKVGGHALLVDFQYGRVEFHSVAELVMLAPGAYEFKGQYKGQLVGPRGLKWRVVCAGGANASGVATSAVGESEMIIGMTPTWRTVGFSFTIPDKDCKAQYLKLDLDARMASEQLVSGSMSFDELRISRAANPS